MPTSAVGRARLLAAEVNPAILPGVRWASRAVEADRETVTGPHPKPERLSTRGRWFIVAVLGLALLLRLGAVAAIRTSYEPLNDARHYDYIAGSIADGNGYGPSPVPGTDHGASAFRPPLYPVVLSAVYVVFGNHRWAVGLAENAVIGTLLVALIGVVGTQLWGKRVGATALTLAAIHPTLILFGTGLVLEPLLATLVMASVAAALELRRSLHAVRWALLTGLLIGLAMLTRELGAVLLPSIAWLIWRGRPRWSARALMAPTLVVGVALLTVAPWTIRNTVRFGTLVPVSSSGGVALAGVYNETSMTDKSEPAMWIAPFIDPELAKKFKQDPPPTEAELDRQLGSAAVAFARDHPSYVPRVFFWGVIRLFDLGGTRDAVSLAALVPYPVGLARVAVYSSYAIYALALSAVVLRLTRRSPRAIRAIPILMCLMTISTGATMRYRASIEPFLVLAASTAVAEAVRLQTDHLKTDHLKTDG
jgi:hypothetical protein